MTHIEIRNASKTFRRNGQTFTAFENVSLTVERGEFICLLGPSGCGKSTLLNALAGFEPTTDGVVLIDGEAPKEPSIRRVTIFQNYGLLPWRSVRKNVELGLEALKTPKKERREIAEKYLELVGLSAFRNEYPSRLSGGMRQRVAIARALAVDPEILFMDEPFGALDVVTRMKLQDDILKIVKRERKTAIFVTHDVEEAAYLADRVVVMTPNPGRIKKIVTPQPTTERRDRASFDFLLTRDKIFEVLRAKSDERSDYVI